MVGNHGERWQTKAKWGFFQLFGLTQLWDNILLLFKDLKCFLLSSEDWGMNPPLKYYRNILNISNIALISDEKYFWNIFNILCTWSRRSEMKPNFTLLFLLFQLSLVCLQIINVKYCQYFTVPHTASKWIQLLRVCFRLLTVEKTNQMR